MLKVRNSLFETNSSSSHVLVYSQKNPNRVEYKLETTNGTVAIHFREYGWTGPEEEYGFGTKDILATANDKLDYVMSYLCMHLNWDLDEDQDWYGISLDQAVAKLNSGIIDTVEPVRNLLNSIQALCPDIVNFTFTLDVEEYFDEETGETKAYTTYPFGYIDHDSQDLLDGEDLINIIFNKGCIIVIDNDHSMYYKFFDEKLKPGQNENLISEYSGEKYSAYNITEEDFEK